MRILGIDPGTIRMGYGVVDWENDELTMVDCGVVGASSKLPVSQRLHKLYISLQDVIGRHQPSEIAIEEPFVAKNVRSAMLVGEARAVAILAATSRDIPVYEYSPRLVKQVVTSYGGSDKKQVQEMVRILLGLPTPPHSLDASDALAVAICHTYQSRLEHLLADNP